MKKLSLYIHIPFCEKKCAYCDFLSGPSGPREREQYTEALCQEIWQEGKKQQDYIVDTVFFGGGTPSLLTPVEVTRIMEDLGQSFTIEETAEITMEVNPGTVNREKLEAYRDLRINRLSIGLQSMNNRQLKELGRIHTREDFLETWEEVRLLGFRNVNVDIMAALPGQTIESYRTTLEEVLWLKPEHISAYSLIIEEGTPFFERFGPEKAEEDRLPSEEEDRAMYELTGRLLQEAGYNRYEISNYSRPGYECRHNLGYWTGKEYLGLGLGASSFMENKRFSREEELSAYMKKIKEGESTVIWQQDLSLKERMEEFMFLGLRCTEGISLEEFRRRFLVELETIYGKQLNELKHRGLITVTKAGRIALTSLGLDVSNQVFVEFL